MKPIPASTRCILSGIACLVISLAWLAPAGAQQPLPPVQQPAAGSRNAPDDDQGAAGPDRRSERDPFLQYAQNVQISVSQIETSDFPTVRAFVSVTDENGINLDTLIEEDFMIEENGIAADSVRFANREELNLPLAVVLVVDISASMGVALDQDGTTPLDLEIEAIREFVSQLEPRDRVGLITFSDAAIREVPLSTEKATLVRRLERLAPWGQTTLWDGIYRGMQELINDTTPARRALIVLSDGMDNKSLETPQTVLQYYDEEVLQIDDDKGQQHGNDQSLRNNVGFSLYALGLGQQIDRGGLGNLATRTGGIFIDTPSAADLADIYQDILRRIQNEYFLEYESPGASQPGQIIEMSVDLNVVSSSSPGIKSYRSPGLTMALARRLWPGLLAIIVLFVVLIIATIFKLTRRTWVTVMITPLEGKDYLIGDLGVNIGNSEICEIRLPRDPAILPLHASISESNDGFVLEAADPESPIIMGERTLARKLLRHGDRFTLGTTRMVFNEKVLRHGEGRELIAGEGLKEPAQALTEDMQLAAVQGAPAKRGLPSSLVAVSGPLAPGRLDLLEGENVLGRAEPATILLEHDKQVSREHCMITIADGVASLVDPGSTNGTLLNGAACQPGISQTVYAGDVLRIGSGEYRLE